tara:strand:- start:677 stop:1411 length:735 start_codon:yes stop_codon:yes gene_type:complete
MLGFGVGTRYKFTTLNNGSTNVNYNVNRYSNNGGGSSTMSKKYGNKFNSKGARGVSNGKNFSINGNSNHYYIGNPNSNFIQDPFSNVTNCTINNKNSGSGSASVKNTKGLLSTRSVNNSQGLKCNSVNSFHCYKKVNKELIDKYEADLANGIDQQKAGLNKHFRNGENNDCSSKIEQSKCFVDRTNYQEELENKKTLAQCKKCNITKDLTAVNSYVVGYDVYLTKLKNKPGCLYKPCDAKNIAC